eukprot:5342415-Amphidinium_carterae.1
MSLKIPQSITVVLLHTYPCDPNEFRPVEHKLLHLYFSLKRFSTGVPGNTCKQEDRTLLNGRVSPAVSTVFESHPE